MTLLWIVIIVAVVWFVVAHFQKKGASVSTPKNDITEEVVFGAQNRFEKNLENVDLPDAIGGRETYIYRNLMTGWFNKLSGQNRYNSLMTQQLRSDWLDYMSSLSDRSTYNFLSLEAKDDKGQEMYREQHVTASRKAFAIEDAFAAAVGKDAIDELARVRTRDFFSFNRHGEMAPEGSAYDLRGQLHPVKH